MGTGSSKASNGMGQINKTLDSVIYGYATPQEMQQHWANLKAFRDNAKIGDVWVTPGQPGTSNHTNGETEFEIVAYEKSSNGKGIKYIDPNSGKERIDKLNDHNVEIFTEWGAKKKKKGKKKK